MGLESDDTIQDAGRRLARDMRAIRTAKGITTDAIIRATKAAPNVVDEFEQTALLGNPMYNRVYLRLFIRGYAEVIGVRTEDALSAADEMLAGTYAGSLRRTYLEPAAPAAKPSTPEAAPSDPKPESTREAGAEKKAAGAKKPSKPPVSAPTTTPRSAPAGIPATPIPKPGARSVSGNVPKFLLPDGQTLLRMVGAGVGVIIVIVVAWILWPGGEEAAPAPDPAVADTVTTPVPALPPRILLPDTTVFHVIAARDTLNPIRVTAHSALLDGQWFELRQPGTPVWIEFQDTLQVRVVDSLEVRSHADDIDVVIEGVLIPGRRLDNGRRLVLSRAEAQAHLDSLRSARALPGG